MDMLESDHPSFVNSFNDKTVIVKLALKTAPLTAMETFISKTNKFWLVDGKKNRDVLLEYFLSYISGDNDMVYVDIPESVKLSCWKTMTNIIIICIQHIEKTRQPCMVDGKKKYKKSYAPDVKIKSLMKVWQN